VEGTHVDPRVRLGEAGEPEDGEGGLRGGGQGVPALLRCGGRVGRLAVEPGRPLRGGHGIGDTAHHGAGREVPAEVYGEHAVHTPRDAGVDHGLGAAHTLLGRLEHDAYTAGEVPVAQTLRER
jgi:hypothetical protein